MDYNTQREKLVLPEYGRNVQKMVNHAISIEDKDERKKAAETIIHVMGSMHPNLKDNRDFKHKLWDHLHIISNFKMNIDTTFEPPSLDKVSAKPKPLPYPNRDIKYMHYGKIVELMAEKAIAMEDGEQKDLFVKFIANHMKLSYITWNKDTVPDLVIFKAVENLSGKKLQVKEGTVLYEHKEPIKQQTSYSKRKKGKYHKNYR
ncbi:MAG: DUF4290 domain-containing protein [Bacteroidota bacterium]|nr:DUF4290 domain-containing protein [Bacteroidota bacterium]